MVQLCVNDVNDCMLRLENCVKHRTYFCSTYIKPALEEGYMEFTLPNKKRSKLQKYRLTVRGIALKNSLSET